MTYPQNRTVPITTITKSSWREPMTRSSKLLAVQVLSLFFLAAGVSIAADEHAWLHVDGKYIKKSPVCTDPNGIWMGCGVALRRNASVNEPIAWQKAKIDWLVSKSTNVNLCRISINNIEDFPSSDVYISTFLAPVVAWLKENKIYSVIDSHYYMRDHPTWSGPFWNLASPSTWYTR